MYDAVGLDLGETVLHYQGVPLNWQSLYAEALTAVAEKCGIKITPENLRQAENILNTYNTRTHPRVQEVAANQILGEILDSWDAAGAADIDEAKKAFFSFFQQNLVTYEDTLPFLEFLAAQGIPVGVLTDVPYGMDRKFVEKDLVSISPYLQTVVTSLDAGYRKPDPRLFQDLAQKLGVTPTKMIFVGNEEKDIVGANTAGCFSVLIDRDYTQKTFGEKLKINSLKELSQFLDH